LLFICIETYKFYDDTIVSPLEVVTFGYDTNRRNKDIGVVGIIFFFVKLYCRSFERGVFLVSFAPFYIRPDLYGCYTRESLTEKGCNHRTETKAYNEDDYLFEQIGFL
jgi:hypothetical protein